MTETEAPADAGHEGPGTIEKLRRGVPLWYAVVGGIGAWTVHLVFLSSFARFTCNQKGTTWVQHLVTLVTAGATVLAMSLALSMVRRGNDDESAGTEPGRTRFLGLVGLLIGGINLALILLEGSYVLFINPCG